MTKALLSPHLSSRCQAKRHILSKMCGIVLVSPDFEHEQEGNQDLIPHHIATFLKQSGFLQLLCPYMFTLQDQVANIAFIQPLNSGECPVAFISYPNGPLSNHLPQFEDLPTKNRHFLSCIWQIFKVDMSGQDPMCNSKSSLMYALLRVLPNPSNCRSFNKF